MLLQYGALRAFHLLQQRLTSCAARAAQVVRLVCGALRAPVRSHSLGAENSAVTSCGSVAVTSPSLPPVVSLRLLPPHSMQHVTSPSLPAVVSLRHAAFHSAGRFAWRSLRKCCALFPAPSEFRSPPRTRKMIANRFEW